MVKTKIVDSKNYNKFYGLYNFSDNNFSKMKNNSELKF